MIQTLLALTAIFLASLAAEAAPQVLVKAHVEVGEQEAVTLGDIADFEGFSTARVQQLKAIRLTDAPKTSEQRVFTSSGLAETFRNYINNEEGGEKVQFEIPSRVVITRKSMKLNESSVKQAILDQLKGVCQSCEFRIDRLALPITTTISEGAKWSVRVRAELPRGTFSYPLEVQTDEGPQTFWVNGNLSILKKVLVAKRNIPLGQKISADDYATELRDITYLNDSAADPSDLTSNVAARGISAEQVIGRSFLKKENAFKYGDSVKVVTGNGSWQISIDGVAQQTAAVGDTAKVKISTQKMVSGTVIDKGVVEVRE